MDNCKKFELNSYGHCEMIFCIVCFLLHTMNFSHKWSPEMYLHKYDGHESRYPHSLYLKDTKYIAWLNHVCKTGTKYTSHNSIYCMWRWAWASNKIPGNEESDQGQSGPKGSYCWTPAWMEKNFLLKFICREDKHYWVHPNSKLHPF